MSGTTNINLLSLRLSTVFESSECATVVGCTQRIQDEAAVLFSSFFFSHLFAAPVVVVVVQVVVVAIVVVAFEEVIFSVVNANVVRRYIFIYICSVQETASTQTMIHVKSVLIETATTTTVSACTESEIFPDKFD